MATSKTIQVHEIPADKLFRFYISDGKQSRAVLWFKCSRNGDLVTKQRAKAPRILRTRGSFVDGRFVATDSLEELGVSSEDSRAHPHLTFHPTGKGFDAPIIRSPGPHSHLPRFDLKRLTERQEVVKHILAPAGAYPIENPSGKDHFYAVINGAYTATLTSELTFYVAPVTLKEGQIPDELILPNAVIHVICSQPALPHSVLIQVTRSYVDHPSMGNMHVMLFPEGG